MTGTKKTWGPFFTWRSAFASAYGPPSSTTRLVLFCLSIHMNEQGESCFPSIDRLARDGSLSRKAVIDHIKIAEETGWIEKQERPERNGQAWRRMQYSPKVPPGIMAKILAEKGGEPQLPPSEIGPEGGERGAEGGEPDGEKVVNVVHPSTSMSTSKRFTPEEIIPLQKREPGPPCAKCGRKMLGPPTPTALGDVCITCEMARTIGKWSDRSEAEGKTA